MTLDNRIDLPTQRTTEPGFAAHTLQIREQLR
jgi:hypothetical protein